MLFWDGISLKHIGEDYMLNIKDSFISIPHFLLTLGSFIKTEFFGISQKHFPFIINTRRTHLFYFIFSILKVNPGEGSPKNYYVGVHRTRVLETQSTCSRVKKVL